MFLGKHLGREGKACNNELAGSLLHVLRRQTGLLGQARAPGEHCYMPRPRVPYHEPPQQLSYLLYPTCLCCEEAKGQTTKSTRGLLVLTCLLLTVNGMGVTAPALSILCEWRVL